ncbi:MAG TPA: aldo/keto reductase [Vicinamibacterales bacterium]|nr:aldo/keto reductase [Vicinamibacterales bacterium]
MHSRRFGRTGWKVSEVGYGMWGMAGWTGSDDEQSFASLDRAIALGCNFFDTAWAYGDGHSERLLGATLKRHPDKRLYIATKIPPKNRKWPAQPEYALGDVYPPEYIREYTERSLQNIGVSTLDLQQLHVWTDEWASDERWQRALRALKDEGLVRAVGISINRWQPANVLRALDTGIVDAVQVVYNVFDQSPEDELFPYCQAHDIAVIARVPFDEGSLTDTLTADTRWPEGDFRNLYFHRENLEATLPRVARLRPVVPRGMTMPQLALRHILEHPAVSTVIPGMRKLQHVEQNIAVSDGVRLPTALMAELKGHRWDRLVDFER